MLMDFRHGGCVKKLFLALVLVMCFAVYIIGKFVSEELQFKRAVASQHRAAVERIGNNSGASVEKKREINISTTRKNFTRNFTSVHLTADKAKNRQFRYPTPVTLTEEEKIALDVALQKAQTEQKIILEWYAQGTKKVQLRGVCGNCEVTSNKSKINEAATKAVVFLYKEIHSMTMPAPRTRRMDQLHIWQTGEAPPSLLYLHRRYLGYEEKYRFNMTQSYRRDSGIYHPYGNTYAVWFKKIREGYHKNISKVLKGKTRVALAVMSNCHSLPAANIRLQFVRDLKDDGLNLHTLGKCFKYRTYNKQDKHSFNTLLNSYKFFFAFENSYHCRDYITEKFFINGLAAGAIPVAWGATKEDYDAIAPPGSYIFADDFNTTKDLVNYINYLDKNDTAFLEYFKWYQMPAEKMPDYGRQIRYCQLCRILHGINVDDMFHPEYNSSNPERPLVSDEIAPRTLRSLYNWYYKTENKDCLRSSSRFYRDNKSLAARALDGRT